MEAFLGGELTPMEDLLAEMSPVDRLSYACSSGNAGLALEALAEGADVNAVLVEGWTPLLNAAMNDHVELVQLMLANRANINAENRFSMSALHYAATNVHIEIATLLIEAGADPTSLNCDEMTPLERAELKSDQGEITPEQYETFKEAYERLL